MEVLVVGAGEVGRWFAVTVLAGIDDAADSFRVRFADADPEVAAAAAAAVGGGTVPVDGDERFDAVCLAVPIGAAEAAVATQADRAERALLDLTGTMATPVAAMREHAPDRERLSLHPLFAPANAPGNVAVVADATGPVTDALRAALAARGNHLFETTPSEHDRAMETVQARAHAAVLAFALAAEDVPPEFETPVSAGLCDLVEQVTAGTPRVYAEIQATFEGAGDVARSAERLASADSEEFERLYRRARRDREARPGEDR